RHTRGSRYRPPPRCTICAVTWSAYGEFLAFALVLVLIPGPDFAVVTKNALAGGHRRGRWTAFGVVSSNIVQGTAAASGLSGLLAGPRPASGGARGAGVPSRASRGPGGVRPAAGGRSPPLDAGEPAAAGAAFGGWRQGFLSNLTNPKVLVFYL